MFATCAIVLLSAHVLRPRSHRNVRFLDRIIACDMAKVRPIGDQSAMFGTVVVAYCDLCLAGAIGRTREHRVINEWRRSMERSIVGNRATSSSHYRPIVRSFIASDDRS